MKIKIFLLLYFLCLSIYSQQFRDASTLSDLDQYYNNNGVSVADYDQDGDLDIFLVSYYSDGNNDSRLLENTNNGNFIDSGDNGPAMYYDAENPQKING